MTVRDSWLAIHALVSQNDLSVVFQPIVDLGDWRIVCL